MNFSNIFKHNVYMSSLIFSILFFQFFSLKTKQPWYPNSYKLFQNNWEYNW